MLDLTKEPPIHWRDAMSEPELRTKKNSPHGSRWHTLTVQGVKGITGERIKLEFLRLPQGPVTTRGAIERFVRRFNGIAGEITTKPADASDDAMKQLAAAGIA